MKSYYLVVIDNMSDYNSHNSRVEGDNLLNQVEESLSYLLKGTSTKVRRDGDEFILERNLVALDKCIEFGNIILDCISEYKVKATLVFTIDRNERSKDENINKLRIGIIKTKFQQRNIVGYIE